MVGCERKRYAKGLCGMHYKRQLRHGDVLAEEPPRGTARPRCSIAGCDHDAVSNGWCHGHYQRWYRTGEVRAHVPLGTRRQPATCVVDACGRTAHSLGLCRSHYRRLLKHGDPRPDTPVRVVTGAGWMSHGYWYVPVPQKLRHLTNGDDSTGEHRLVMAQHLGRALYPGEVVHHRNGIRTDNRIENLELWSTAQCKGQRVEEKVDFAVEVLRRYRPDLLAEPRE